MLKRAWKTLLITSIVTLLPIPVGLVLWDRLPDVMATHFGTNNEANGFSSKPFAVFFIPLFCLAMLWICAVITANDPRKKNISPKIFRLALWIIPVVSLICGVAIYTYNLGHPLDISSFMMILMGILFILIGNYMPKTRQNYTIGIKVPWTLDNEENWNRTHRLAGYLWVAGGIILVILALIGLTNPVLMIGVILVFTLVPTIYSWWLHAVKGL